MTAAAHALCWLVLGAIAGPSAADSSGTATFFLADYHARDRDWSLAVSASPMALRTSAVFYDQFASRVTYAGSGSTPIDRKRPSETRQSVMVRVPMRSVCAGLVAALRAEYGRDSSTESSEACLPDAEGGCERLATRSRRAADSYARLRYECIANMRAPVFGGHITAAAGGALLQAAGYRLRHMTIDNSRHDIELYNYDPADCSLGWQAGIEYQRGARLFRRPVTVRGGMRIRHDNIRTPVRGDHIELPHALDPEPHITVDYLGHRRSVHEAHSWLSVRPSRAWRPHASHLLVRGAIVHGLSIDNVYAELRAVRDSAIDYRFRVATTNGPGADDTLESIAKYAGGRVAVAPAVYLTPRLSVSMPCTARLRARDTALGREFAIWWTCGALLRAEVSLSPTLHLRAHLYSGDLAGAADNGRYPITSHYRAYSASAKLSLASAL
jgi:hypothetical protein